METDWIKPVKKKTQTVFRSTTTQHKTIIKPRTNLKRDRNAQIDSYFSSTQPEEEIRSDKVDNNEAQSERKKKKNTDSKDEDGKEISIDLEKIKELLAFKPRV
jgi:hypothetical protein